MGVVALLRQGDTKGTGADGDMSDKAVIAVWGLDRGAFEGLAITDQLIQSRCPTRDLADHPGLEHLAELLQVSLVEQVEEGGICRPALEVQAQRLVQRFPVPFGEGLQIALAPAVTEDPEHRDEQEIPLRIAYPAAVAAIGYGLLLRRSLRLEEADQVGISAEINRRGCGLGHCEGLHPASKPGTNGAAKGILDGLSGGPGLRALYSAADAFVLPSRQDNLPNTGLEAHACGTPVVAFNTGGLPDIVADRVTGALAEPFEPASLAAAIRWVLEDAPRRLALGVAARERAERLWAPARVAGLYAEVYEMALAR